MHIHLLLSSPPPDVPMKKTGKMIGYSRSPSMASYDRMNRLSKPSEWFSSTSGSTTSLDKKEGGVVELKEEVWRRL